MGIDRNLSKERHFPIEYFHYMDYFLQLGEHALEPSLGPLRVQHP